MIKTERFSLYLIISLSIVAIISISMFILSYINYETGKQKLQNEIRYNSNTSIIQLQKTLVHFIESYQINEYEKIIENEMGHKSIMAIVLEDFNMGKILGETTYIVGKIRDESWNIINLDTKKSTLLDIKNSSALIQKKDIINENGIKIGIVTIYSSDKFIKDELCTMIQRNLITTLIITTVMISLLYFVLYLLVLNPISRIIDTISNSDKEGLPKEDIELHSGTKEMLNLSYTINKMVKRIKESTQELEELNTRFKLTFEGINDGIWDWSLNDNHAYFSDRWKSMLGFSKNDIGNNINSFFELVHDDDKNMIDEALNRHFKDPENNIFSIEIRMRTKNNSYKWIRSRGKVILDEDSHPIRMLGTHTDIDKNKKLEEQIIKEKLEFESIFRYTKDGIVITDTKTNFIDFNDAYLDITGLTKEDLFKTSFLELVSSEDIDKITKGFKTVIEKGHIENYEITAIVKDDTRISLNMSITLMPDKQRFLFVIKDVTTLKTLEEQAKLASMGEMIGNIAHQWRQPLSVITTAISGLKVKTGLGIEIGTEEITEVSDAVIKQAKYLSKTIDDFRNFIRGNKDYSQLSVKNMVQDSISLIESALSNNFIETVLDLQDDIMIEGNKNELQQALINIINNAKDVLREKVQEDEDKLLFISTKKIDNDNLQLTIKDSGGGIPEDILERIFVPYFTTKNKLQGTGLGLSMADKILRERHNATISVFNENFTYKDKHYRGASFVIKFHKDKKD